MNMAPSSSPRILTLPAATGWRWVLDGFRLLRRQPIALLAITFMNLLLLSVSVLIPLVGSIAPLVLTPALMVGLMHAIRAADRGEMPMPLMLLAAFREYDGRAWRPLLVLGGVNALCTVAALALAAIADNGTLMRLATGQIGSTDPAVSEGALMIAAVVFLLVYAPAQMAMWYAPLFVAWHRTPVPQALFFSLVATWRNRRAFAVYAIGWFGIALAASLAIRVLQLALDASPVLLSMVLSPLSLVLITAVYCSFWPTYRDAVESGPPPGAPIDDASAGPGTEAQ
ncbi:MAG TPA: BPSS1780 family membrane protein [Burkholderiaceae bacterium]|jgi:hypothetical protein|nr:BPSS1780 family membrane protein [Burkholderiaceae bacterium]